MATRPTIGRSVHWATRTLKQWTTRMSPCKVAGQDTGQVARCKLQGHEDVLYCSLTDIGSNAVPIAGTGGQNYTDSSQTQGINLWYGADPTTLRSVEWSFGTNDWNQGETLEGYNAHAGVGCYSWGPGTVTYLMASDLSDTVNILWKDLSQNLTSTSSHPVAQWTNSSVAIPNSFQNTSLGYTEFLYLQDAGMHIVGYNISWNAEETTLVTADSFTIDGDTGIPGTRLTVTATPNDSGGQNLLVFDQNNGSSITEYVRDLYAGQWTSKPLPIPNE